MSTKFIRFAAALAILVSIAGNTGSARAAREAAPSASAQKLQLPRSPQPRPGNRPALLIPPASSLGVEFVHVATAANISVSETIIDNPLTNGHPDAIILVTPNWNPGDAGPGMYDDHPIGVFYDGSNWTIFNEDEVAMSVGAAFKVFVPPAGSNIFVQTAIAGNTAANVTYIDNPLTNGNPNAILFVTPNYDPGGVCPCMHDSHPIGVYYDGSPNKWGVFNQDHAAMPLNASFNVFVLTAGAGVIVHTATAGNSTGDYTFIDNPLTNGNPNAIVYVTPNWNPGGGGPGVYNNHNVGVYNNGTKWAIFSQDQAAIPLDAAFNVLVLVPTTDFFVHTATAGNSAGDYTKIDNAQTNEHQNAIVLTTPSYNPNGNCGCVINNHNIGVFSLVGQWTIFNQDGVLPLVHAAFNVVIPTPGANVFVYKATAGNTSANITTIDNPLTNGSPNAMIFVTPNWNPGHAGGTTNDNPIGVAYNGSQWEIFNQDGVNMPLGAAFNVFIPPPGSNVFVHKATIGNSAGDYTVIHNPLTDGNPNAILLVTPNWNPGGGAGQDENHPIGVFYLAGHWTIFNQDGVLPPVHAAFNVLVYNPLNLPLLVR